MTTSKILNKLACLLMKDGKKNVALRIIYKSLALAAKQVNTSESILISQVLGNIKPVIDARTKKVGRISYIIPYALREDQSIFLALKILVDSSRNRREIRFYEKLANELIDSFNNKGASVKRKNEIYQLAEANKAFANFR